MLLGFVTEVWDPKKFIIKFTIPEYIKDAVAYPLDTFDEPNVGDPVAVYKLEDKFGYSWMYSKERLKEFTRLKLGNSNIEIHSDRIEIRTEGGNTVNINSAGQISIKSDQAINIESSDGVTVKGSSISFEGPITGRVDMGTADQVVLPPSAIGIIGTNIL